ncbi:conjugal transfer protein [Lachnospiraceae bacterium 62-35]
MCTRFVYNGNEKGKYSADKGHITIADLTENYIQGKLSFNDALDIVQNQKIVYAKDAAMQAMFSDKNGRVLIIEPGIGYRLEQARYSLITNYSVLSPEVTRPYIVSGDDRFERAKKQLEKQDKNFSVTNAFHLLKSVRQEGIWATRVSFVYSVKENQVYYVLNNDFDNIIKYRFTEKP